MPKKLKRFVVHFLPKDGFYSDQAATMNLLAVDEEQAAERFRMFSSERILVIQKVQWLARYRWLPTPFYLDARGELTPYLEFANLFQAQRLADDQKKYVTETDLEWVTPYQLTLGGDFRLGQAAVAYFEGKLFFGAIKGCQFDQQGKKIFILENHLKQSIQVARDCLIPCTNRERQVANSMAAREYLANQSKRVSGF